MTLMLHAGANPVEYAALRDLPIANATATHVPIPHYRVVDLIKSTLGMFGHMVEEEHYGVTPDGFNFFGALSLKSTYGNYTDVCGIRNSHVKKFPVGIAFGSRVFVCDNLAFVADHVIRTNTRRSSSSGSLAWSPGSSSFWPTSARRSTASSRSTRTRPSRTA